MTKEKPPSYTYDLHLNHKRYLDMLRIEFEKKIIENKKSFRNPDEFDVIKNIGSGAYGTVYLVRDKSSLQYCAMKAIEKAVIVQKKLVKQLYREKQVLESINFPFLLNMGFSCKDNLYIYFITSFESGGELFRLIRKSKGLSEEISQFFAAQVTLALEYLHNCYIVHRDVKPENIFINESGYIKLGDFGFAKVVKNRTWSTCGTPEYLAPEIITSKGYSFSVDWWSFGVLVFEMVCGYPPFYHSDRSKLYELITIGNFKVPNEMSSRCKALLKRILQVDPNKRLGSMKTGAYDIKSHPWFENTYWDRILQQKLDPPYKPPRGAMDDTSNFADIMETKIMKSKINTYEKEFADF